MKIIDFRLRPPFKDFLNEDMHLFRADDPFVTRFFKQNGFPIPESNGPFAIYLSIMFKPSSVFITS